MKLLVNICRNRVWETWLQSCKLQGSHYYTQKFKNKCLCLRNLKLNKNGKSFTMYETIKVSICPGSNTSPSVHRHISHRWSWAWDGDCEDKDVERGSDWGWPAVPLCAHCCLPGYDAAERPDWSPPAVLLCTHCCLPGYDEAERPAAHQRAEADTMLLGFSVSKIQAK